MKKNRILILGLVFSIMLAGCGGSSSSKESAVPMAEGAYYDNDAVAYADEADYDDASYKSYDYEEPEMVAEEATEYRGDNGDAGEVQVDESAIEDSANQKSKRMLIKTVYMNVESEDVDTMMKQVEKRVDALGGYIESMNVDNTKYSNSERKTANITARVPVEKLDQFCDEVEGQSNVLSKSSNAEDVTLKYVDMQSRMDSLQIEYDRISELLKQADELENIIELEKRLTDIRYEMQSYGSQLKAMKNQATYSTINLSITQVIEYTPVVVEEQTRLERLRDGFITNCKKVGNGIVDFFVGLVIALPVLLVWAVVIFIIVLIIKAIVRKCKDRPKKERRPSNRNTKGRPQPVNDQSANTGALDKTADSAVNTETANGDK